MKKIAISLAATSALMLGAAGPATASAAAVAPTVGQVKIVKVGTDAMGTDNLGNRNREFVTFKNVSGGPVDVAGLLVEDNWAHERTLHGQSHTCNTFKIADLPGSDTTEIAAGEYVTVFNGARFGGAYKVNSEYRLYANSDADCGTAGQFYDNNNDTAWVTLSNGTELSKKSWDWNGGYSVYGG